MKIRSKCIFFSLTALAILFLCFSFSSCILSTVAAINDALNDMIPKDYWEKQVTDGEIEAKYVSCGSYEIESKTYDCPYKENKKDRKFFVCYPKQEGKYPLVIMVNGTGVPYDEYNQIFEHLASWGYVVAGNDYEYSWDGSCSSYTLDFVLSDEKLSGLVDENKIAIGGHSQGGEGTFTAITEFENGSKYKACFSLSPTCEPLAVGLGWTYEIDENTAYDLSKVKIPTFMVAGTGTFDSETVCPLTELQSNFNGITEVPVVIARRKDTDHGDMLWRSDPYVTAWLELYLKGVEENRSAFFADNGELAQNKYWCDYASKAE